MMAAPVSPSLWLSHLRQAQASRPKPPPMRRWRVTVIADGAPFIWSGPAASETLACWMAENFAIGCSEILPVHLKVESCVQVAA